MKRRRPRYSLEKRGGKWMARCVRQFSDEMLPLLDDEVDWATSTRRIEALFWWHRNFGLARRTPHPMGKNLGDLQATEDAALAERYQRTKRVRITGRPPAPPAAGSPEGDCHSNPTPCASLSASAHPESGCSDSR